MTKLKFTKAALAAMIPPEAGKRLTVYDTDIPKLALRLDARRRENLLCG